MLQTNQANSDAAMAANNLTMTAYNNTVQRERDLLAWAWQSGENEREQANNVAIAKINADGKGSKLLETAAGKFIGVTSKQQISYSKGNNMTYDPRSIYQSYAQYGQNKKKQNTNTKKNTTTGLGSKLLW